MPSPVHERAEKLLLNVRGYITNVQSKIYETQDRIAKQVQDIYSQKGHYTVRRGGGQLLFGTTAQALLILSGASENPVFKEIVSRVTECFTSVVVDSSQHRLDGDAQKLHSRKEELSTINSSLTTAQQAIDTTLSRLQNAKGNNG